MDKIDWDGDLTAKELAALKPGESDRLSKFFLKLAANVRIQKEALNALKEACRSFKDFKGGGITDISVSEANDKTTLSFDHDGKTSSVEIPCGLGTALGITSFSSGVDGENNVYKICYGEDKSVTITAKKGPQGEVGSACDGTTYYNNGAVESRNSVAGVSLTGSFVTGSVTGFSGGASGLSMSVFGVACSAVAAYNSSAIVEEKGAGAHINGYGAYQKAEG